MVDANGAELFEASIKINEFRPAELILAELVVARVCAHFVAVVLQRFEIFTGQRHLLKHFFHAGLEGAAVPHRDHGVVV